MPKPGHQMEGEDVNLEWNWPRAAVWIAVILGLTAISIVYQFTEVTPF